MKLKLLFEEILLEIGDSAKIYSFSESQIPEWNTDLVFGSMKKVFFLDKFNQRYIVELEPKYKFLDVGFKISGEEYDQETKKFDVLSIMNTVSEIVKFTIQKNTEFLGIRFTPSAKGMSSINTGDKGESRDKLYRYYITKKIKELGMNTEFIKSGGTTIVKFI